MKKFTFSLPLLYEGIKIIGKPIAQWSSNKSGQELYAALEQVPIGTFQSLETEIITNVLCKAYNSSQLKKIKQYFDSEEMSCDSEHIYSPWYRSLRKGIEKTLEMKEKEEIEMKEKEENNIA